MCLILKKEVTKLNFGINTQPRGFGSVVVKQLNFFRCPCLNLIHFLRATPEFNLSKKNISQRQFLFFVVILLILCDEFISDL